MSAAAASKRRAIVCGSGIAGLSSAIALARNDWSVDVYERNPAVREIGAGIFVKGNGLRVLSHYGVTDRIRRDCVVLREARILDRHGKMLQRRMLRDVNAVWNVKRQLLIRVLFDRATDIGVRVHLDSPVEDVSPEGAISVRGRRLMADLVVVADGVNSVGRHSLGLNRATWAPKSGAIRLLVPRRPPEAEDMTREFWSGTMRVGVAPCTETEVYSYIVAPLSDARGARAPIDAAYWASQFPQLAAEGFFERADLSGGVHHPYPFVATRAWIKGRAALVGDAAHALPPTLGQGAGLSLMNTLLLSEYVSSGVDVPTALAAWERDWRWVSNRTQAWARRYDWITSEWPDSIYMLRNAVIWSIGKCRRLNNYMRIADRVDAPHRRILRSPDIQPALRNSVST
jgi:2-polyprenyl-6-methoxyphenol hydroxylase-like FAD-dependent oxidoreductase